jgi:arsenite oxidase small subunit
VKSLKEQNDRRKVLKLMLGVGFLATMAAAVSSLRILTFVPGTGPTTTATGGLSWPRLKVTNVKSLENLKPVSFNYPLDNTPNLLVKLSAKAENGVGPDGDIVAFSDICQHLGCFYAFQPPGSSPPCDAAYTASSAVAYCCCHGSVYDFLHNANVLSGPAPRPVPRVMLEYDDASGDIYVVGMAPPNIYGHGPPGVTDPAQVLKYDLEGGQIVTEITLS